MSVVILYIVFFVSGFCGLCYEVIWGKEFHMILGHTTYAVSAVLTAFMSGFALGSYLIGKKSDSVSSSLSLYAYLEFGIGFFGIFFPFAIELYKKFYVFAFPYMSGPSSEFAFRFASAFLIIIVPTTLMGATFPAMSKIIIDNVERRGYSVGLIYFLNSVGGAFGCLVCGFYLLFELGTEFSLNIICSLNILCGVTVIALRKYLDGPAPQGAAVEKAPESKPSEPAAFNPIFVLFMVSGFVSMLLEITWTRLLILVMGSSTHSFSMMLFTFILFLAAGSLLISKRADSISDPMLAFAVCEAVVGAYAVLTIPFYENLPYLFVQINTGGQSYFFGQFMNFFICMIVMAVPALAFGATFPIAVKAVRMDLSNDGGMIGKLYSFNTLGCILGSLITGIFILPRFGFRATLTAGILTILSAAVAASLLSRRDKGGRMTGRLVLALAAFCAVTLFIVPEWDKKIMNIGSFYRKKASSYESFRNLTAGYEVLYYRESISATVCVVKYDSGQISLRINGKTDGSTGRRDMITQRFTAILPMMRVKSPRNVLVIGMGTGTTLATVCMFPKAEKITCVEIVPEVVEAAKYFPEAYEVYSRDPRVSIVVNDARSFLLTSREKFDVIISEPSNPWIAGIGSLFTTDFFTMCRDRLSPDGCMLAWIQAYESSEFIFKLVMRTFLDLFPDSTLWFNTQRDVYIISGLGGKSPARREDIPKYYEELTSNPALAEIFKKSNITDEVTFATLFYMTNEQLWGYAGDGLRNSDNFQIIEYEAPKQFFLNNFVQLNYRFYADNLMKAIEQARLRHGAAALNAMLYNAASFLDASFYEGAVPVSILDMAISADPGDHRSRYLKGELCMNANDFYQAYREFDYAVSLAPGNLRYLRSRAGAGQMLSQNRLKGSAAGYISQSVADWTAIAEKEPEAGDPWFNIAMLQMMAGDHEKMTEAFMKAVSLEKKPQVRETLLLKCAMCLIELQRVAEAIQIYKKVLGLNPANAEYVNSKIAECETILNNVGPVSGGERVR